MKIVLAIIFILVGFLIRPLIEKGGFIPKSSVVQVREDSSEFKYINPFLLLANAEEKYPNLNLLKKRLEKYIEDEATGIGAEKVSVYFRKMNSGEWTGVNEDELYAPASMLKVATLIAYLKVASRDSSIFSNKLFYEYQDDSGQFYKPIPLKAGLYSELALLQQMILHSDNNAMNLIDEKNIPEIIELYEELKLSSPIGTPDDFMSPRSYSRFLRTLYNSTYLSRSYSEQALKLLTYSNFNKGLRGGVPEDIEIAHKFGEHTFMENGKIKYRELHDCGIIYFSKDPYLLCIMTKGSDFNDLEKVITNLSKIVFDYQKKFYE